MAADFSLDPQTLFSPDEAVRSDDPTVWLAGQVQIRNQGDRLQILLPPGPSSGSEVNADGLSWLDLRQQVQQRLDGGNRLRQGEVPVDLVANHWSLDVRQLQDFAAALTQEGLRLEQIQTTRRQTAVSAATAGFSVDQTSLLPELVESARVAPLPEAPLYLQTTLRSGAEIRHSGSVVLVGDLNPGSAILADGDILVWGRLRGIAHAGAVGNENCRIMALLLEPTQLRIATLVARPPEPHGASFLPEVAYVVDGGIRISPSESLGRV
jgi:septum site-determining protein MinC